MQRKCICWVWCGSASYFLCKITCFSEMNVMSNVYLCVKGWAKFRSCSASFKNNGAAMFRVKEEFTSATLPLNVLKGTDKRKSIEIWGKGKVKKNSSDTAPLMNRVSRELSVPSRCYVNADLAAFKYLRKKKRNFVPSRLNTFQKVSFWALESFSLGRLNFWLFIKPLWSPAPACCDPHFNYKNSL